MAASGCLRQSRRAVWRGRDCWFGTRLSLKGRDVGCRHSGGMCAVGGGQVVIGGITTGGAVSGPLGGDVVAVELGEVVGCHQWSPLGAHRGAASSVKAGDTPV